MYQVALPTMGNKHKKINLKCSCIFRTRLFTTANVFVKTGLAFSLADKEHHNFLCIFGQLLGLVSKTM